MKIYKWVNDKLYHSNEYSILGIILLISLIFRFIYYGFLHPGLVGYNPDTVSYFTNINLFKGIVDPYRTPVYPLIIKLFEYISNENFIKYLILFQQIMLFLSIIPFFYVTKNLIRNRYIMIATVLFYGCWNYSLRQCFNIHPESLCIVASVLLLYLFTKYIEKGKSPVAFLLGFSPFILTMLKPVYLITFLIVPVFFIFRIIFRTDRKRLLIWGFAGWIVAISGLLGYCEMNKTHNGEFVLTKVTLNNSLANVIISGAYKNGDDKEFIAIIDSTKQKGFYYPILYLNNEYSDYYKSSVKLFPKYLTANEDMNFYMNTPDIKNYPYARLKSFINKSQHTTTYISYIFGQFIDMLSTYIYLILIILIEIAGIIYAYKKHKSFRWILSICIFFVLSQFVTISVGGIDDWKRLIIPSYPFVMLIIFSFINHLFSRKNREWFVNRFKAIK